MDDLISRAAALDVINTWGRQRSEKVRMALLHRDLDAIPAVNAVPVVRCKDCKHRIVNENAGKKGYLALEAMCALDTNDPYELGRNAEDPDWFCADGERRDEDETDRR